jgi:hypothetical protein
MLLARWAGTMLALRRVAFLRLILPLLLLSVVAGSALASGANQSRGRTNRTAILKNRTDRGEKGRVRTQFVRDTGKSSLVKVTKLDGSGKPTGEVEAFLVDKQTGAARRTSSASLASKTAKPKSKKVAAKSTARKRATPSKNATRVAAVTTPAVLETVAPAVVVKPAVVATTPVVKPAVVNTAPAAVMEASGPRSVTGTRAVRMMAVSRAPGGPGVSSQVAEQKAVKAVATRLKALSRAEYEVAPPFLQFESDRTNPVTGSGLIEVRATQKLDPAKGRISRILRAFNPRTQRRIEVMIDQAGEPHILTDQADSFPYRAFRKLKERLPIGEFIKDAFMSEGARKGGLLGALAGGVAFLGGPVGIGVVLAVAPTAFKMTTEGINRRRVARQTALDEAAAEIKTSLKNGETVNIGEAYTTYKTKLSNLKRGETLDGPSTPASAISMRDFVEQISAPPYNL